MRNQVLLFSLSVLCCFFSETSYSQTPITDANFSQAIATCLSTNPVDGMCASSQYGAMPNWDVSNVTDMNGAFFMKSDFNAYIGNWDVSNVTNMVNMFALARAFNQDIGNWNVNNVTEMRNTFFFAETFNQDLGNWDVSNVTNMVNMFEACNLSTENYDAILNGWSALNLQPSVELFAVNSFYCTGEQARQSIIDNFGWQIIDAGLNCNLGINSITSSSVVISPNPATSIININSKTIVLKTDIYNQLGQVVLSCSNQNKIDLSSLSQGLYYLKVEDVNGNIGIEKVIKE